MASRQPREVHRPVKVKCVHVGGKLCLPAACVHCQIDDALIVATLVSLFLAVGVDEITETNAPKFWRKVQGWQKKFGPLLHDRAITQADVVNHIGLKLGRRDRPKAKGKRA